ncbi:chaperonin 10-like protein [Panaeolus papilionaceus]|nr:chaperonin 10-like protein [Panaeolus papilionaceus]
MTPETMRAIVTCGDGKFQLKRVPVPSPKPNEILVKVEACAQNHTDCKSIILDKRAGNIVGSDFAGVIVAVGEAVPVELSRRLGDRIAGAVRGNINPNGAFSEYVVTDPALVFPLPDDVPFELGAQLGVSCYAACQALYQTLNLPTPLDPTPEEVTDILVWSGSSHTGQYAIQIAKLSGLRVVATCSPKSFDFVKSLGAVEVFDYSDSRAQKKIVATTGGKLRYAIDCYSSGTSPVQVSGSLSKEGGTIVTMLPYETRKKGVKTELVLVYSLWGEAIDVPGISVPANPDHYPNGVKYNRLIGQLLEEKKLTLGPIKLFSKGLASVEEGFAYMLSGKIHAEKIVYKISDTPDPDN